MITIGRRKPSIRSGSWQRTETAWRAVLLALVMVIPVSERLVAKTCSVSQVTHTSFSGQIPNTNAVGGISSNGLSIVFQSDAEPIPGSNPETNFEIWLFDVATSSFTQVTDTSAGEDNVRPSISGDGLWVVFEGSAGLTSSGHGEIMAYDVAASSFIQITDTPTTASHYAAINGDGSRISFASTADLVPGGNADGNQELFLYDRGANAFTQITSTVGGHTDTSSLDWSGNLVAFDSTADVVPGGNTDGNTELYVYDVQAGTTTQITSTVGGGSYAPSLSRNGEWISFQSNRDLVPGGNTDGSLEVFLYNMASATFTQVTDLVGSESYGTSIDWPGRWVAFASFNDPVGMNPDGNNELFLYDAAAGPIMQITDTTGPPFFYMMDTAISDDGQRIAFDSFSDPTGENGDGNGEIFLATCASTLAPAIPTTSTTGGISLLILMLVAAGWILRRSA